MWVGDLYHIVVILLVLVISVLVGVAFLTLMERKILGYLQIRKGPKKVGNSGLLQPFSDALKLLSKEGTSPNMSNFFIYYTAPILSLLVALLMWASVPFMWGFLGFHLSVLYFLCCSSLGVYFVMVAGWASNSKFSLLGSLRSVAQTVSYEVSLFLILLSFLVMVTSVNMVDFMDYQFLVWSVFISLPLALIWFVSSLAETNRSPFDFAEGESELVSGFNTEYSGGGFVLFFLSEYASILFMSMLIVLLLMGGDLYSIFFFMKLVFFGFLFIWVRGTLPRFRYDKLMDLSWKAFLPVSLNYLFFFFGLKVFIFSLIS
uniref:NADH-ubiquinone oxidoreductase chain 1 n=1 Tax=Ptilodactylidae sp. 3 ACP-2013 TaxID=1434564 RepID=A0A3G3FX36_9COLE|nr:NADH dehydrogenase subunit 1 [Ptilodactylidae sp. 3 ACP-2013]